MFDKIDYWSYCWFEWLLRMPLVGLIMDPLVEKLWLVDSIPGKFWDDLVDHIKIKVYVLKWWFLSIKSLDFHNELKENERLKY